MPPHTGHLHLVAAAQAQVDRLHVILFSKSHEPIPGDLRAAWLHELLPGVALHHIARDHRVDFDDPSAWDYWVSAIRAMLPHAPDIVFSSEPYGAELAQRLGVHHIAVDPQRRQVPISATQIRDRPLEHWAFIPPVVRPYFVRRVALLGAESTGKTTLAQALAEHFQTAWAPEYAREYLLARGGVCTPADMPIIARGQARLEDERARLANRLLLCDTLVLTTLLWHEHYFGPCPPEIRQLAAEQPPHLCLLCSPDTPWVADGLRDSPGQRGWFHERYRQELETRGWPFLILSGPPERRLATAIGAVEGLIGQPVDHPTPKRRLTSASEPC